MNTLSPDLTIIIANYCDIRSLYNLMQVSKRMFLSIQHPETDMFEHKFKIKPLVDQIKSIEELKELYFPKIKHIIKTGWVEFDLIERIINISMPNVATLSLPKYWVCYYRHIYPILEKTNVQLSNIIIMGNKQKWLKYFHRVQKIRILQLNSKRDPCDEVLRTASCIEKLRICIDENAPAYYDLSKFKELRSIKIRSDNKVHPVVFNLPRGCKKVRLQNYIIDGQLSIQFTHPEYIERMNLFVPDYYSYYDTLVFSKYKEFINAFSNLQELKVCKDQYYSIFVQLMKRHFKIEHNEKVELPYHVFE